MMQLDLFGNTEREPKPVKQFMRRSNGQFATKEVVEKENTQRLIERLRYEAEKFKRAWLASASFCSKIQRENLSLRKKLEEINRQSEVKGGAIYA